MFLKKNPFSIKAVCNFKILTKLYIHENEFKDCCDY